MIRMMKTALIPLFLIITLSLSCCAAEEMAAPAIARGFVYVSIINEPPRIVDIGFSPEVAYSDSAIRCIPAVVDEVPKEVRFEYRWYVNGDIEDNEDDEISGLDEGEKVSCEAIPIDVAGQRGTSFSKELQIENTPLNTKIELAVLNGIGVKTSTERMIGLERQGLGAMTGYVAGEIGQSGEDASYVGVLVALVLLFVLVDANLLIRYIIRRRRLSQGF